MELPEQLETDSNICIHEGNAMNLYSSARKQ